MSSDKRKERWQAAAHDGPSRPVLGMRRRHRLKVLVGAIIAFVLFYEYILPNPVFRSPFQEEEENYYAPNCPTYPLAKDILLVLRTGATESLQKLPIHFETTLQCIPNHVIYSDYSETIQGHRIHDVLDSVSSDIKATAPEFALYKTLQKSGRAGIQSSKHHGSGPKGSLDNPAWKLDKFKFLPMVDRALKHQPKAKWFVFIEADTYLMWTNLLAYLSKLDDATELYIGKHMYIGSNLFAHGGSGFILSSPAAHKVVAHWRKYIAEYESYTVGQWAGDMVLGKVLKDVGIRLHSAFPHFQGDAVWALDYNSSSPEEDGFRRLWCYAPITYHHMSPGDIRNQWAIEQDWRRKGGEVILHRDVFRTFVWPRLTDRLDHWDNLSMRQEDGNVTSVEECQDVCKARKSCLQYRYTNGKCFTSDQIRLGEDASKGCVEYSAAAGKCIRWNEWVELDVNIQSGWIMERIPRYIAEMDDMCDGEKDGKWVV
jgi:hypothetical protein